MKTFEDTYTEDKIKQAVSDIMNVDYSLRTEMMRLIQKEAYLHGRQDEAARAIEALKEAL